MSQVELDNAILFARGGFRGLKYNEGVMSAVAEAINGMEIENTDGKVVGRVTEAHVDGSLIRGSVSIDQAFLSTKDGKDFIRRTNVKLAVEEKPKAKTAAKPATKAPIKAPAKTVTKIVTKTPEAGKKPVVLRSVKSVKSPAEK
jgi:sporulation protein YlmC with PRC-barrel domain